MSDDAEIFVQTVYESEPQVLASDGRNVPMWATSLLELRAAYRALRRVIAEHPDRAALVRRYEEIHREIIEESR